MPFHDLGLPDRDGMELLETTRRRGLSTPILLLTARDDAPSVVAGLNGGADDYLRKPFEMPELVARVRAALRRRRSEAEAGDAHVLRLGPLRIDPAGRTVERGGTEIALTRTEFDLLVELARHPGRVFPRDLLLDRVWGYDYLGDSRLVDVAVGRLRAKVEADPAAPELILTVRGAGYKAARAADGAAGA
jgi:two-component system response regulator MtrA